MQPVKENDTEAWAAFLVESVFFVVTGLPYVLRSGQGPEFVAVIVKSVIEMR